MFTIHKLKPDRSITGLIPAIVSLISAALIGIFFGKEAAYTFIAMFFWAFAAYNFITLLRTGNANFIVPFLYLLFAGLVIYFEEPAWRGDLPAMMMLAILFTAIFLFWLIYLFATKKLKWRGREVLELAAAPVEEAGNGYTPRPLPSGKTEFSTQQIMEFAGFARRNLIAVSYVGKDKVIFVPVRMGREFGFIMGLKNDYTDETWISFDFDGHVTVNISHRDYLEYK
ncbi:MAG: hypothetical protein IMY76_08050, partial [Chloroflexi bacterium]|nr:hypothetical protein [Chloroflexota bacterium]